MPIVASPIDLVAIASYQNNGVFNQRVPHWTSGGALYAAAGHDLNVPVDNAIGVWKSEDDGATWTRQDTANEPANCASFANCIDGDIVYFLCGARSDDENVPMRLFSFDCTTDTWTLIDDTGPVGHFAGGLVKRSDGSFMAVYGGGLLFLGFGFVNACPFDGTWGTELDITAATGVNLVSFDVWTCVDAEDRTHIFVHDLDTVLFSYLNWYHCAVEADDTIGAAGSIPALDLFGGAVAVGDSIYLACSESSTLKLLVGTPLNAPSFSLDPIDAMASIATNLVYHRGAFVLVAEDAAQEKMYLFQTLDLITWSGSEIYDIGTNPPPDLEGDFPSMFPAGLWVVDGEATILLGSNYQNEALGEAAAFYIGAFPFTPAPPSVSYRNTFE